MFYVGPLRSPDGRVPTLQVCRRRWERVSAEAEVLQEIGGDESSASQHRSLCSKHVRLLARFPPTLPGASAQCGSMNGLAVQRVSEAEPMTGAAEPLSVFSHTFSHLISNPIGEAPVPPFHRWRNRGPQRCRSQLTGAAA